MSDNEHEIVERLARLETKLDMFMNDKSYHHRLSELEDNQKWLWRTVLGGIIAGAIAFITKL